VLPTTVACSTAQLCVCVCVCARARTHRENNQRLCVFTKIVKTFARCSQPRMPLGCAQPRPHIVFTARSANRNSGCGATHGGTVPATAAAGAAGAGAGDGAGVVVT
jgi:hypothetical protein